LKFINSKAGIAAVAVVIMVTLVGWHKVETSALELKIAGRDKKISQIEVKVIEQQRLKETCQLSLSDTLRELEKQNSRVDQLNASAERIKADALAEFRDSYISNEEIEKEIVDSPDLNEMNAFMNKISGRLAR